MAKYFMDSDSGANIAILKMLKDEGHDVLLRIRQAGNLRGMGEIKRVLFPDNLSKDTLIILDGKYWGENAQYLESKGYRVVVAPNAETDDAQNVRSKGYKLFNALGIETLAEIPLPSPARAMEFVHKHEMAFDIVSHGIECSSYKSAIGQLNRIHFVEGSGTPLVLRRHIKGITVALAGFIDDDGAFLQHEALVKESPVVSYLRSMPPSTTVSYTCISSGEWFRDRHSWAEGLRRLIPTYRGPYLAILKRSHKGAYYGIHWRFEPVDTFLICLAKLLNSDLHSVLIGKKRNLDGELRVAMCSHVRINPWPLPRESDYKAYYGLPIYKVPSNVYLRDYMLQDGIPVIAGTDGILGCAWAVDKTALAAKKIISKIYLGY